MRKRASPMSRSAARSAAMRARVPAARCSTPYALTAASPARFHSSRAMTVRSIAANALQKENNRFRYYGYGPGESYCDSFHHALCGWHESTAEKEYVNYVRPQEHGNHYGVRSVSFPHAFTVNADQPFEICVSQYSTDQLYQATHTNELGNSKAVHLRIDYKASGLGSASCGPALPECYRLQEKDIHFEFELVPSDCD